MVKWLLSLAAEIASRPIERAANRPLGLSAAKLENHDTLKCVGDVEDVAGMVGIVDRSRTYVHRKLSVGHNQCGKAEFCKAVAGASCNISHLTANVVRSRHLVDCGNGRVMLNLGSARARLKVRYPFFFPVTP